MIKAGQGHERLAAFIRNNIDTITHDWTEFARTRKPASETMSKLALEDHIADLLSSVADDLESPQTAEEQVQKSHGEGQSDHPFRHSAAQIHASLRLQAGFDIDQMVSEYRALRASVVKQWVANHESLAGTDVEDLTRFNEAIDQAVAESVAHYTKSVDTSRNLFLGVLGHDLRNPIGAVSMAAKRLVQSENDPKQVKIASQMVQASERATRILNDLLDLTRSAFGTQIPLSKSRFDVAVLCREIASELRGVKEGCHLVVKQEGDPTGYWDVARMGQVLSNLMGNAIEYSDGSGPITVTVSGTAIPAVEISVHNFGKPIPPENQTAIFKSWMRGQDLAEGGQHQTHLGLGLYISSLVVEAHSGMISVNSDATAGTTFRIHLPRE